MSDPNYNATPPGGYTRDQPADDEWECPYCGEYCKNADESCWICGEPKPGEDVEE